MKAIWRSFAQKFSKLEQILFSQLDLSEIRDFEYSSLYLPLKQLRMTVLQIKSLMS